MARPRTTSPSISYRLPLDEYAVLEQWSDDAGETVNTFARDLMSRRIQRELAVRLNDPPTPADPEKLYAHLGIHPTMKGPEGQRVTADGRWIHPLDSPGPTRRPADGSPALPYDHFPNYLTNE